MNPLRCLLYLTLAVSVPAFGQNSGVTTVVDEFTGATTIHSEYLKFNQGLNGNTTTMRLSKTEHAIAIVVEVSSEHPDLIATGDKLYLKLDDGGVVTLTAAISKAPSQGMYGTWNLRGVYVLSDADLALLASRPIEKIRLVTYGRTYEIPASGKRSMDKCLASIKEFAQALSK